MIARLFYNYRTNRRMVGMPLIRAIHSAWINSTRSS